MKKQRKHYNNQVVRPCDGSEKTLIEKLIGVDELSTLLGLSKKTVYDFVYRRELKHFKLGRRLKFRKSDLEAWLQKKMR